MSAADTPMVVEPSQPKLSEAERITNIFVAPSKTFTDLKRSASWWLPFLLISVMSLIYVAVVDKKIGWDQVVDNKMSSMSEKQRDRMEQAPPEARAQQTKFMKMGFQYGSYASPIFVGIFFAVLAAIYMAIYNFGLGAEVAYKHSFAVLMYAALPGIVRTVLAIIVAFVADPSTFNFENPVVTNPGFLVSEANSPAMYGFLSKLDLFALWSTYLTGLGFACISKVKQNSAIGLAFGIYATYVLVTTGFRFMFS